MSFPLPTALDDGAVLDAWERTLTVRRPWREVALLTAACDWPLERIARLPIGERDRRLIDLRMRVLGDRIECAASCPQCSAALEWTQRASALRCEPPSPVAPLRLADGVTAICRVPDSADLAACEASEDPEVALLERCATVRDTEGTAVATRELTSEMRVALDTWIEQLDPQTELLIDVSCPDCRYAWQVSFDVAGFVLEEIDTYARHLLADVHDLARAYGWREADILAMGRARRRRYLDLLRS